MASLKDMGMPTLEELRAQAVRKKIDEFARNAALKAIAELKSRGTEDSRNIAIVLKYLVNRG